MDDEAGKFTVTVPYEETSSNSWRPTLEAATKCHKCGKDLPDADCVSLEAPEDFAEKHLEDHVPILIAWHRECFEKEYGITLPEFKA